MFVKLVILILVVGSSGVGVLSVRQSRLQAAHETAEARLRIRKLENRTTELKAAIAQQASPDRLVSMLESTKQYNPAVHHPAQLGRVFAPTNEQDGLNEIEIRVLDDGTQILILPEESPLP